jgi:solute:Na+ symporter, SSS family
VQYAFSGYSALMPLLVAALFWKRSTKWGALASTLWAAGAVIAIAVFQSVVTAPAPGNEIGWGTLFGQYLISRTAGGTSVLGLLPVVPMTIISAVLMIVVSMLTAKPDQATIKRYFTK